MTGPTKHVEWVCTQCGRKEIKSSAMGRPSPGTCPRRPKVNNQSKPHVWVKNRTL